MDNKELARPANAAFVVLHTAVAWQTVNELACGESGIVHGAECMLPFLTESLRRLRW